MKSLSTPQLARKLRGRLAELYEITEELARRNVEVDMSVEKRFTGPEHHYYVHLNHVTRKEVL